MSLTRQRSLSNSVTVIQGPHGPLAQGENPSLTLTGLGRSLLWPNMNLNYWPSGQDNHSESEQDKDKRIHPNSPSPKKCVCPSFILTRDASQASTWCCCLASGRFVHTISHYHV